jgi:hypothetical protein
MALVCNTAKATDNDEYDIRVGIVWAGEQPLMILTRDASGYLFDGASIPLHHYTPVETTVNAAEPSSDFHWHMHDLAQDCVNQGGISNVRLIHPPDRKDEQELSG